MIVIVVVIVVVVVVVIVGVSEKRRRGTGSLASHVSVGVPHRRERIHSAELISQESAQMRLDLSDKLPMLGFKKLDVYKCSIDLLSLTMQVVTSMADTKNSGALAEQLRRAALSIPLNIGEGAGRRGRADQAKFYVIARGSAMECAAILDAARAMGMIDEVTAGRADELVTRIVEMLTRMCHFRD